MLDFYTQLASEVLHKPYDEITEYERQRAKKYVYARIYNVDVSVKYVNRYTFSHMLDASDFMDTVSTSNKAAVDDDYGKVVVFTFDNAHDAYINMCEACSTHIHIEKIEGKVELPE